MHPNSNAIEMRCLEVGQRCQDMMNAECSPYRDSFSTEIALIGGKLDPGESSEAWYFSHSRDGTVLYEMTWHPHATHSAGNQTPVICRFGPPFILGHKWNGKWEKSKYQVSSLVNPNTEPM
jgi:hypothetical protein